MRTLTDPGLHLGSDDTGNTVAWQFLTGTTVHGGIIIGSPSDRRGLADAIAQAANGLGHATVHYGDRDGDVGTEAQYFDERSWIASLHHALKARLRLKSAVRPHYPPEVWNTVLIVEHAARILSDGDPVAAQLQTLVERGPEHGMAAVLLLGPDAAANGAFAAAARCNAVHLGPVCGAGAFAELGGDTAAARPGAPHALQDGAWRPFTPKLANDIYRRRVIPFGW